LCLSRTGAKSGGPAVEYAQASSSYRTLPHLRCSIPAFTGAIKMCWTCEGLKVCARITECDGVHVVLPPAIYSPDLIPCESVCLFTSGFSVDCVDMSHALSLAGTTDVSRLSATARKHLRKATEKGYAFQEVSRDSWHEAYDVVRANRAERRHPLRIGEAQMGDLVGLGVVEARCFVVRASSSVPAAAAIVFDVTPDVSQVIYWGDIGEYRADSPMMVLADGLMGVYGASGKRFLDIGPSSDRGVVDCGLADFKKSIGCMGYSKLGFTARIG
jgi:hypothetical protein